MQWTMAPSKIFMVMKIGHCIPFAHIPIMFGMLADVLNILKAWKTLLTMGVLRLPGREAR